MAPDPRWLEILKASGWQTAAIAATCGLFLLLARWSFIPPLDAWMIQLAAFGLLLSAFLAVASVIVALNRFFPLQRWIVRWVNIRREQRAARNYLPHMTAEEKKIVAYLLAHNQKTFTAAQDGGYATTLISRGIVVRALRPGQVFAVEDTPMAVPDHIWTVPMQHKHEFPISDAEREGAHPWRVPWMVR